KSLPALARSDKDRMRVKEYSNEKILAVERWCAEERVVVLANVGASSHTVALCLADGPWRKLFDSAAPQWAGPGSELPDPLDGGEDCRVTIGAHEIALFRREVGA